MELTHFPAVIKLFGSLDDPRQAGKVQYPLPEILLLVLCAAICSTDSIVEIGESGELKLDFLLTLLPYKNGIPSHDTIGKLLASIDYRQFGEAFIKWTNEILQSIPELVAIDGKTQRRTMNGDIPLLMKLLLIALRAFAPLKKGMAGLRFANTVFVMKLACWRIATIGQSWKLSAGLSQHAKCQMEL